LTPRLYFEDPLLSSFDAETLAPSRFHPASGPAWPSVVLSRTAFYPEAGGQMADRGSLFLGEAAPLPVVDVQVDDDGRVHHRLEGDAVVEAGLLVRGEVDRARRRVHMALHTGQHMLSRALLSEAGAATVSARLGETACTIDLDRQSIDERALARAEDLVNAVIDDDRSIRAFFPTAEELASLELRRAPKVQSNIRVVVIDDFDVTPCGGTHCRRTGQVGLVALTGVERYKGKTRVTFVSGRRGREALRSSDRTLRTIATALSSPLAEVPIALERLRAELAAEREKSRERDRAEALRTADALLRAMHEDGTGIVVARIPGADVESLRIIAGRIVSTPGAVAALAGEDASGSPIVVTREKSALVDCGAVVKAAAAAGGGKGGGRPEHAEGRLPQGVDPKALLCLALEGAKAS